ncbi:MAG: phosphoribosylamine--glycine ligase [Hyphomicrobiaceae bacterium]|nr:phosphoribosylamine--glycine ligase [Hyphomicrobiaceae bacterium]
MNLLLLGSGGREHALAWTLCSSPLLNKLYCAPGNAGIESIASCVNISLNNFSEIIAFCREKAIEFVVVGSEIPLVAGIVDELMAVGITVFGPSRAAAQLEGSKGFAKDFCREFGIPTADYARFSELDEAINYVQRQKPPIVIKADGLAAGKGVEIAQTISEAVQSVRACFAGAFGTAGYEVVIEEFLIGQEASFFALVDGSHAIPLGTAQDYKRLSDGNTGPNTGGMGAFSPALVLTEKLNTKVMESIIVPTIRGMAARRMPYTGVLYAGLMITEKGPQLIEYNVRFGDPECQVLMFRLETDLLPALLATCNGSLNRLKLLWKNDSALTIVMAAEGYPHSPQRNTEIKGLDGINETDAIVFHAGTVRKKNRILANSGRVLNITARGRNLKDAQKKAYDVARRIDWPESFYRDDIGGRSIESES